MVDLTFEDAFKQRIEKVEAEIALAMEIVAKHQAELEKWRHLLETMPDDLRKMSISAAKSARENSPAKRLPKGQIKRLVLEVLGDNPIGLDALQILDKINQRASKPYMRTSLSPQLSRLKDDGYITLEGKIWRLKKIEPLDANPSKEPSKGSDSTTAKDREAGSGGSP